MDLRSAINEVKTNLKNLSPNFSITIDLPYKDTQLIGSYLLSEACSGDTPIADEGDFLWYNIANYKFTAQSDNAIRFDIAYYDTIGQRNSALSAIENLASQLQLNNTTIDEAIRIQRIYNWICTNCTYNKIEDRTIDWTGGSSFQVGRNALYDVFVSKQSPCQGFSRALYYVINKYICPCRMVQGNEYIQRKGLFHHCWNIAYVTKGGVSKWYYIDVTAGVHEHDEQRTDFTPWLLKNASDFNNNPRNQKYSLLPQYMRFGFYYTHPISSTSYQF